MEQNIPLAIADGLDAVLVAPRGRPMTSSGGSVRGTVTPGRVPSFTPDDAMRGSTRHNVSNEA